MEITIGSLVKSLAGHDKDEVFFILKEEGEYVYLVDGKYRTLAGPKRKNRKPKMPLWSVSGRYKPPRLPSRRSMERTPSSRQ